MGRVQCGVRCIAFKSQTTFPVLILYKRLLSSSHCFPNPVSISIADFSYRRYGVEEVALAVAHAVLQGLENHRHTRLRVRLCSQALCGLCDESAWRLVVEYERLLKDTMSKRLEFHHSKGKVNEVRKAVCRLS